MKMPLRISKASRELLHPPHRISLRKIPIVFQDRDRQPQNFNCSYNTRTSTVCSRRNDCNSFSRVRSSHTPFKLHNANTRSALNYSTPSTSNSSQKPDISTEQYHKLADTYIDVLVSALEEVQEKRQDVDCEYSVCAPLLLRYIFFENIGGAFLCILQTNPFSVIGWCLDPYISP